MSDRREVYAAAAYRVALVAGIFCVVLGSLLLVNSVRMYRWGGAGKLRVVEAKELLPLKAQLRANPGNTELVTQIRELDQRQRANYFRRQHLSERAGVLLVAGTVLFIAAFQTSLLLRRPKFRDPRLSTRPEDAAEALSRKRFAVGSTALVVSSVALAFVWGAKREWVVAEEPVHGVAGSLPSADTEVRPPVAVNDFPTDEELAKNWGRFRGPTGQGVANVPGLPDTWSGAEGTNILWKTEVPLPGQSSPVVWGDRIYVTGANEQRREVFCFDAKTGALVWREPVSTAEAARDKPPKVMEDTSFAGCTPVTNGRQVVAMFANGEVAGFGLDGKKLWAKHLGTPHNNYGHATSLAMWRDRVIVVFDQDEADKGLSKIYALNAATGDIAWSAPRAVKESWATPVVAPGPAGDQVITSADPFVIAYNPEDGKELWKQELMTGDVAASPIFRDGQVYVASDGACLAAIGLDGKVAWKWDEGQLPDICSPLCDGPRVYILVFGTLTAFDVKTGKMLWEQDLEADCHASPSLVNGQIWALSAEGVMVMGQADEKGFKETGRAELGEKCGASPAFAPGRVYIRGKQHLYGIGAKEAPKNP